MRCLLIAIVFVVCPLTVNAEEGGLIELDALIQAGERAVIRFHFDQPPVTEQGEPVNFLVLDVGGSYVDFLGDSRLHQSLHDGKRLLAVREAARGDGLRALFVGEDAAWNGVEADFSRIRDGSIEGVLIVEPKYARRSVQSRIQFSGRLTSGRAISGEGVQPGPSAVVTSCRIEAPIFGDRFDPEVATNIGPGFRDCVP